MCILKGKVALLYQWPKALCLPASREYWAAVTGVYGHNLQGMDSFRHQAINYSELSSSVPWVLSYSFLPGKSPLFLLSRTLSCYFLTCFLFFLSAAFSLSVFLTAFPVPSAVLCWASGSSLVLQRRSLIQCFKSSQAGCDWFHFTLKALTCLSQLSGRIRLMCKTALMLFTIKHFSPFPYSFRLFFLLLPVSSSLFYSLSSSYFSSSLQ